ncbi:MAG TPA: MFS transporter [Candidatus Binatia bacterium]|nr:MFS transporter [Candidatus Binatia bacterium]
MGDPRPSRPAPVDAGQPGPREDAPPPLRLPPDLDRGAALSPLVHADHPHPLHAVRPAVPPRPEDAAGFLRVLRKGDFRYLWFAQCVSQFAQNCIFIILLIVIYRISQRASISAVVAVLFTLPGVVLSAPAGVFADRHDKRTLMLVTNLARAVLLILAGLSTLATGLRGQAWPLLVFTLLFSSAGQLFAPAEAASIPSLVSREQLQGATSLFMTTVILTIVLGAALGSVSVGIFGDAIPFYIAAAFFGVAALFIWRIGASLHAVPEGNVPQAHILAELREGLAILRRSPPLRWGMIELGLALVIVFTIYALGPDYMTGLLGSRGDQQTYVVLLPATFGLVAMAGVLGQHLITLTRRTLMVTAFLSAGGCLLAIGIGPPLLHHADLTSLAVPLVVLLALVFGLALGAVVIPAFTVLQEGTTEESRGRIFGGVFTVVNVAIAIPALLAGAIADAFSVYVSAAAVGIIVIAIGLGFRLAFWERLKVLGDGRAGGDRSAGGP